MEQRRKFERVTFREPVQYNLTHEKQFGGCLSFDLSVGGLQFRSFDFFPVHKEMTFSFSVQENRQLSVSGRVAWIQ